MATVGVIIPSFIIIFAISLFFDAFLSFALVAYAFRGIQVCVVYLIFSAGLKMLKSMKKTVLSVCIVLAVASCMIMFSVFAVRFSSILYILICGRGIHARSHCREYGNLCGIHAGRGSRLSVRNAWRGTAVLYHYPFDIGGYS